MAKTKEIILLTIIVVFFTMAASGLTEVVILKDGSKYIGKVTTNGDEVKIATEDGELTIKKDRIKAIYQDAQTILKELSNARIKAQELIESATKIEDLQKRNAPLDKAINILTKAQNMCMDVIDAFTGKDAEAISIQFMEINSTFKLARSMRVLDKETVPPQERNESPKNNDKPSEEKTKPPEAKPDIEALEAAREFYGLGLASFKSKQYDKARELLIKSIAYNKNFPEAYAKLGDLYMVIKEDETGYGYYLQCIEIINALPTPPEEMIKMRDDTLRKIEKFRLLEEKIAALNKELMLKLLDLGSQCINDEDYIMSEEILALAKQLDMNNEEADGLLKTAREEINKGLGGKPVNENVELANLYYQSGLELLKNNKHEEAVEKLNKALTYRTEFPEAWFNLGECHKKLGDNKKALYNYRLCARCLKQNFMSKENEKLLAQTGQALDKIDPNGKKFAVIKTNYIAASSALANDCANKKYNSFAWRVLQSLMLVDPANKNALDLSDKVNTVNTPPAREEKTPAPEKKEAAKIKPDVPPPEKEKGTPQNLFNGKDINNWKINDAYPTINKVWGSEKYQNWRVKDGKIQADPRVIDSEAVLIWKGEVPAKYTLVIKFSIDRNRSSKTDPVSFIYGEDKDGYDKVSISSSSCADGLHKFELIRDNDMYKAVLDGRTMKDSLSASGSPAIGLMVKNGLVSFTSVILQEK